METVLKSRDHWAKKREYILASAGNVVGLGNVWRFPYLCYKNGGGVFLIPYCFFAVLCGVPLYLLETVIGQYTQEGTITCWTKVCPMAQGVGYSVIVIQLYSRAYIIVLAWALLYLIYCFSDPLPWATCNNPWNTDKCVETTSINATRHDGDVMLNWTSGNFTTSSVSEFWERKLLSMSAGIEEVGSLQWELLLCLLACWLACYFSVWKGVRTTGKVVYVTAVFPYVMLVILLVRGLTLPGAWQGVVYYLYPDPSRLTDLQVWLDACSQVLFSYGVASGSIITLGSYNKEKNNCYKDSLWLCALNSCTSFVAGFAVFSTLGFMAHRQALSIDSVVDSGPGLAFIAFPQAVAMMPLPQLWAVCFFIMLILLGLDTVFTGLETITSTVVDLFPRQMRRPWRREIFLALFCLLCFIVQLSTVTEGGVYLFQLVDFYGASGASMLFVGLLQCVAAGWVFGAKRILDEVEKMIGQKPTNFFGLCWRYFTPLLCAVCFVCYFLEHKPLTSSRGEEFPVWAYHLGWAMALSSIIVAPIWVVCKICLTKGPVKERFLTLLRPAPPPDAQEAKGKENNKAGIQQSVELLENTAWSKL